jgi:ATP-dependent DNA helicase RecG
VVTDDAPLPEADAGLSDHGRPVAVQLRRKVHRRRAGAGRLDDTLPEPLRRHYALMPFADSVDALHRPRPPESFAARHVRPRWHPAWRRIKFDELLAQQLSLRRA